MNVFGTGSFVVGCRREREVVTRETVVIGGECEFGELESEFGRLAIHHARTVVFWKCHVSIHKYTDKEQNSYLSS